MPLGCHFERILKVQKVIWRVFWLHLQAFGVPILRGLCFQGVLSSKKMRRLQANPPRDLKETRFPLHGSPGASGGDPGSQRTSSLISRPERKAERHSKPTEHTNSHSEYPERPPMKAPVQPTSAQHDNTWRSIAATLATVVATAAQHCP